MALDFRELAQAVKKNNMGLGGFRLQASARIDGERVALVPTGQAFRLRGRAPPDSAPAWRTLRVLDWSEPSRTAVEVED